MSCRLPPSLARAQPRLLEFSVDVRGFSWAVAGSLNLIPSVATFAAISFRFVFLSLSPTLLNSYFAFLL